jgi:hypothetical protein
MNFANSVRAVLLISAGAWPLASNSRSAADDKQAPAREVALFDAQAQGQLAVKFVPSSEKKGMLTLLNRTRAPLAVQIPATLGARPVLAQFVPNVPAPQTLGLSRQPQQVGDQVFRAAGWNKPQAEDVVKLPPNIQVRIPLQGVCLEYGNPTPNSRMRYELVPVERVISDARVAAALLTLSDGTSTQPVVQAVAWHVVNGKSWKSLSRKFSKRELESAQRLLQEDNAPTQPPATPAPRTASPGNKET